MVLVVTQITGTFAPVSAGWTSEHICCETEAHWTDLIPVM
jgi:hypothetical protein